MGREPSISHWCEEDSRVHLDQQLRNADASREEARDYDFELPFIETDQPQISYQLKGMHMNGAGTMGDDSVYLKGNRSEKYVSLDIENEASRKEVDSTVSLASHGSLGQSSTNPVSVADVLKTLFFILLWLEKPSFKLSGIISVISIGILLTVAEETEFEFWGLLLVMLAAVMSGFRWCMTQILLQKEAFGMKNPLTFMSYVSPVMAGATAILSLAFDPWDEFRQNKYFNSPWHISQSCLLMLLGGALAFLMVFTEYVLVSVTSAVTVTIAGVVKESVTILVAVLYFHDQFTWLKGLGLLTIIFGVSLFNWYKYWRLQKGETSEDDVGGTLKTDTATKYVILDDMDEQKEST